MRREKVHQEEFTIAATFLVQPQQHWMATIVINAFFALAYLR